MNLDAIREVCRRVAYKDWIFEVTQPASYYPPMLTIIFYAPDAFTSALNIQRSLPWLLEPKDESELLRTVWLAIITAEEHEARELFTYKGKHIFGPHKNHVPQDKEKVA